MIVASIFFFYSSMTGEFKTLSITPGYSGICSPLSLTNRYFIILLSSFFIFIFISFTNKYSYINFIFFFYLFINRHFIITFTFLSISSYIYYHTFFIFSLSLLLSLLYYTNLYN